MDKAMCKRLLKIIKLKNTIYNKSEFFLIKFKYIYWQNLDLGYKF